ncbi:MAG TPA: RHS repeat-associated core domain-containing protein, partial [Woeseiaceae bacterium]|nr:RHS repeat-associated core domain-containing protein [Woeseiaceae bacterium]
RLRNGQLVAYTYDNINRVTFRNAPGSSNDQTFTYDLLGRLLSVSISGHTNSFTYNALGQLTSAGSPLGSVSYQYGTGGRRIRMTYPDGFYVRYDYDWAGAMTRVRENGATSGAGLLAVYSYDNLGRRTSITRGNGVTTTYGYDAASRLDSLTQNLAGSAHDLTTTFNHNSAGQVSSRTASNDLYAWTDHTNMDNLTQVNGRNQITSEGGVSFAYDARGNLTSDGVNTYGYDADNRLVSGSGGLSLAYDAVGRLYKEDSSSLPATRFLYDGADLIAEYNASGTLQRRFVYGAGAGAPLVWYEGQGTSDRRWLLADERGSVLAVTSGSGSATVINRYDEYGQPSAGNLGRFQYTGQAWSEAAQAYYYKARFYAPEHGRFLQSDPIGYSAGLNLYAYVGHDPVNAIDPSGMIDEITVTGKRKKRGANARPAVFGGIGAGGPNGGERPGRQAQRDDDESIEEILVVGHRSSGPSSFLFAGLLSSTVVSGQPQRQRPEPRCTAFWGALQDATGGESNQAWYNDVVDNFVETTDTGASALLSNGLSMAGASISAKSWGGITLLQLGQQAWECPLWPNPNAGPHWSAISDECTGDSRRVVGCKRGAYQGCVQRRGVGGFRDPHRRESCGGGYVRAAMTPHQSADNRATTTPLLNKRRVLHGTWLFVPGALAVLFPGWFGSVLKLEPWIIGVVGVVTLLSGLYWSAGSAKCPRCKLNLLWHGMTHATSADWFTWLVTVRTCPRCGYPESDRSEWRAG